MPEHAERLKIFITKALLLLDRPREARLVCVVRRRFVVSAAGGASRRTTTSARAATVVGRCPAGTVVLGGTFAAVDHTGAYINTVVPLLSVPTAGNGGWMVQARNSQRGTWTLRTTAICGAAPAGYQVVVSQTARDATITKQQTVSCPAGKRTTGGGYVLHDGNGQPIDGEATYVMPSWDATSWLVNARAVARGSKWVLTLYAVCADATLPGFEVATSETVLDPLAVKQLTGPCSIGKVMTGAGWGVVDGTRAILEGRATAHEIQLTGASWLTNAVNLSAFSPSWRLQQRAICVD